MKTYCIVGFSQSGKTSLIEQLIPEFMKQGLRVATIKHTHHTGVSLDTPGKDTYRYQQAGAEVVGLASPEGYSIAVHRKRPYDLASIISDLPGEIDIVLVEGFKKERFPKIELVPEGALPLFAKDPSLLAIVSGNPLEKLRVPCFSPNDSKKIADFLVGCSG